MPVSFYRSYSVEQRLMFTVFMLALLVVPVRAQEAATERAARLRAQLADLQAQQTELQSRLAQIDEDIKPENIERSMAGVGSTHPEELREARRRQLEIQRQGIQSQLDSLAAARARLEAAIAATEAQSYRDTVGVSPVSSPTVTPKSNSAVSKKTIRRKHRLKRRRPRRISALSFQTEGRVG